MRVIFKRYLKITMSDVDEDNSETAELCWMCEQPSRTESQYNSPYVKETIDQSKVKSVQDSVRKETLRDQCHIKGTYRGAAHVICNKSTREHFPVIHQLHSTI